MGQRQLQFAGVLTGLVLLSACAAGNVTEVPEAPPITIVAQPTPVAEGVCEDTSSLEQWAQSAHFISQEYGNILTSIANESRVEMYDDVLRLVELRDTFASSPAPDCAVDAQNQLVGVMDEIIETLQSYVNADLANLGNSITEFNLQLDNAGTLRQELEQRIFSQYQAEE